MNNQIQDERILAERRKIQGRAYGYIIYALVISMVIKIVFMGADFKQYATEFLILIGSGVYIIIANYLKGINIWAVSPNENAKKWNKNLIIAAFIAVILNDILLKRLGIGQSKIFSITYGVAWTSVFLIISAVMNHLNKKRQEKIDKQINDDDE